MVIAAASLALSACATSTPAPVEFRDGRALRPAVDAERPETPGAPPGSALYDRLWANQEFDPGHSPDTLVVERGMTLWSIAERYRIPFQALVQENKLQAPYHLAEGQTLVLPAPKLYVVQPGETLMTVALKFSIDPRSLALYNRWEKPWVLEPGDEVMLPPLVGDAAPRVGVRTQAPVTPPTRTVAKPAARPSAGAPTQEASAPTRTRQSSPGAFTWPVKGAVIEPFGPQPGGARSDGVAIAAPEGAPFKAAAAGVVVYAGDEIPGYGNLVLIRHEGGFITAYAHARQLKVREGQKVDRSTVIGEVGQTGSADRPQLHFEIRQNARAIDPLLELPAA